MRHLCRRAAAAAAILVLLGPAAGCGGGDDGGDGGDGDTGGGTQGSSAAARAAAGWLQTQLSETGLVHNDQYDLDDYGLTLDVLFALDYVGTGEDDVARIRSALEQDPAAYTDAFGTESAGSTGKLVAAVESTGGGSADFGGVDLVTKLEGLVRDGSGPQAGRGVDRGGEDYSNTIGQAWVVRGLALAESDEAEPATEFLLDQQCTAGFYREAMTRVAPGDFGCDGGSGDQVGSVDATSFAVLALADAAGLGRTDVDEAQEAAAEWLESQQAADGSFAAGGVPNSNSTAVAATALRALHRDQPAARAAKWLAPLQVTEAVTEDAAAGPRLTAEVGAVAYDPGALARAERAGITPKQRDQWRRATAQAAMGLAGPG